MDGLARPIGAGSAIMIKGKTYRLPKLTVEDFGEFENYLLLKKRALLFQTIAHLKGKIPHDMWLEERAAARDTANHIVKVSPDEVADWMDNNPEGLAYTLLVSLEKNYPGEFTLESLQSTLSDMTDVEIEIVKEARDQAAGQDEAGKNSTGPEPQEQAAGPNPKTGDM